MTLLKMNRREFFRATAHVALATISVRYLFPANAGATSLTGQATLHDAGLAGKQLYEGRLKVTGAKIYAIDFRARDLAGWPAIERRSVVLRASIVDKLYMGLNIAGLEKEFGKLKIVTGDDLHRWGCKGAAPFLMPTFYVRTGTCPNYFGQPIALLGFESTDHFLASKAKLATLPTFVESGPKAAPPMRGDYGKSLFVYYQGDGRQPEFSFMQADRAATGSDSLDARNAFYLEKIQEDLDNADWLRLQASFQTQSVDPMFMEPENGLSWYDSKSQTLSLTLGTQSPHEDAVAISHFFAKSSLPRIKHIHINCCFLGGGFGGKDSSDFPLHLAIAALTQPDVSHRIVYSRPEQFQAGIKRHAAKSEIELAVNRQGIFEYLRSSMELDGGGQNNYSFAVQSVGARNAAGAYRFARSQIDAVALASTAIPAGSMRGFGSFQPSFGLECLIDEAAQSLGMDPIELRLRNLVKGDGRTQTGVELAIPTRGHEVLEAAKQSDLWKQRKALKEEKSNENTLYGTGFAAAFKTFGKHENGCLACVELTEQGMLKLHTPGVDMGNGSATTLSLSIADILGRPADEVQIGVTAYFDALNLVSTEAKSQAQQDLLAANPYWTPSIAISTAASTSAYHLRHATLEAAKLLRDFGLIPAAVKLLQLPRNGTATDDFSFNTDGIRYRDSQLLTFPELAAAIYQENLASGVMVHAYYRESWAEADFSLNNVNRRIAIDGLCIRHGVSPYVPVPRRASYYSPLQSLDGDANRMSSYAVIVSVTVARTTGQIKIEGAEGFLDCGPPIVTEIVQGQMNGAFAMGIGQALTETLSVGEDSAGQGNLNLHLYRVPLAMDCAVGSTKFHILPDSEGEPRGMSEVVFNPIASAILNAVADATGKRFRSLPVHAAEIRSAIS
jgi:CO/xanthine dehydrogenase Mo-binding subunit